MATPLLDGCYQAHERHGERPDAASPIDAARADASMESCSCPCADPSRACTGRPATLVTLTENPPGGGTPHRVRDRCIELTYDPSVRFPMHYEEAMRDWMRDCPDAFCVIGPTARAGLPRFECAQRIHFARVGAIDEVWGSCSGGEGSAGYVSQTSTGEIYEACVEVSTPSYPTILRGIGQAMGLGFVPGDVDSVMANPGPGAEWLSALDREGFCAAYGGAGFCAL